MLLFLVMLLFSAICSVISFGDEAIRRTEQTLFPISSKFVCRSGPHRMMSLRRLLLLDRHRRCLRKLREVIVHVKQLKRSTYLVKLQVPPSFCIMVQNKQYTSSHLLGKHSCVPDLVRTLCEETASVEGVATV